MNSHPHQFTDRGLSRRQFGLVLSGGAFLLLAGGTYGVVGRSPHDAGTSVSTPFGSVAIVQAGRLARLDSQGQPAFATLSAAATQINAAAGRGGTAQIQRASTSERIDPRTHGHDGRTLGAPAGPEPLNLTWGDVVLLEVRLLNDGPVPVLFSPGQLRLRLDESRTVTLRDSDRGPGPLAPHGSEHILISYLAPRDSQALELDYVDDVQDRSYRLALPALTWNESRS